MWSYTLHRLPLQLVLLFWLGPWAWAPQHSGAVCYFLEYDISPVYHSGWGFDFTSRGSERKLPSFEGVVAPFFPARWWGIQRLAPWPWLTITQQPQWLHHLVSLPVTMYRSWTGPAVLALYPLSILLVYIFDYILLWDGPIPWAKLRNA